MDTSYTLAQDQVSAYRRDGYIQLDNVISGAELAAMRAAVAAGVAADTAQRDPNRPKTSYEQIFIQCVNLWQRHDAIRPFVLSRRFARLAAQLCGSPVRIWHDQALFKEPHTGAKTPWHQDTPYWPHIEKREQLTIWIALQDATVHNGCMSFLPGTQKLLDIEPVNLGAPQDLYAVAPSTRGIKPVTCELKAGSCTFHNGMTFHYAGPNRSDAMREAFAIIYMPDGTRYDGAPHLVTDALKLKAGVPLGGDLFPLVS
jgi:phytanoyl-CoA hydroxylase